MIAVAIGFGLIDGCPLPTPGHVPAWELGIVEPIRRVRDVVETPVAWMRDVFYVSQQWSVYQAPIAERYRMTIDGLNDKREWQVLYRAGDRAHRDDAALIEHARVWGTWDPTSDAPALEYRAFCTFITLRMIAMHPDLLAVRVRQEKIVIGQGEVTPTGEFLWPCSKRVRF